MRTALSKTIAPNATIFRKGVIPQLDVKQSVWSWSGSKWRPMPSDGGDGVRMHAPSGSRIGECGDAHIPNNRRSLSGQPQFDSKGRVYTLIVDLKLVESYIQECLEAVLSLSTLHPNIALLTMYSMRNRLTQWQTLRALPSLAFQRIENDPRMRFLPQQRVTLEPRIRRANLFTQFTRQR
jgi:hypothetical protein